MLAVDLHLVIFLVRELVPGMYENTVVFLNGERVFWWPASPGEKVRFYSKLPGSRAIVFRSRWQDCFLTPIQIPPGCYRESASGGRRVIGRFLNCSLTRVRIRTATLVTALHQSTPHHYGQVS